MLVNEELKLELGPITNQTTEVALAQGWFDDEVENRKQGFGKGDQGRLLARKGLLQVLSRDKEIPNTHMLGITIGVEPVGYVTLEAQPAPFRTVDVFVYLVPSVRGKGYFKQVLDSLLGPLFQARDVYRVEVEVMRINKSAIKALRQYGFVQESVKKGTRWMDGNVYDSVMLRILRPELKDRDKEQD